MNCSCSADQCPHIRYVRSLLEMSEKDQLGAVQEAPPPTGWAKFRQRMTYLGCFLLAAMRILYQLWLELTKFSLELWLRVINSNRSFMLGFVVFGVAVICSLPGVRGSATPAAVGRHAEEDPGTELVVVARDWL
uniref:Putative membrane protein n=1 Tax=Culex tarsalis TaxID=7177 RepID=A0A1Q3FV29_CULTA